MARHEGQALAVDQGFADPAKRQLGAVGHQEQRALVIDLEAVVVINEEQRVDHDHDGAVEFAFAIGQAARDLDLPVSAGLAQARGGEQSAVGIIAGQGAEVRLLRRGYGIKAVGRVEHGAVAVEQGHGQIQARRQHAVEQAVAAGEFGQAQTSAGFLELQLEQLGGVIALAQDMADVLGQHACL